MLRSIGVDCCEVFEVSMVGQDFNLMRGALEAMAPFSERGDDGEEFYFV